MKEQESRPKISLEDLLRVKRSERPPAEFWNEFDQQLRRKQLAALVDARPRWRAWLGGRMIARICVPLGATAALVFAIGSVRTMQGRQPVAAQAAIPPASEVAVADVPAPVPAVAAAGMASVPEVAPLPVRPVPVAVAATPAAQAASEVRPTLHRIVTDAVQYAGGSEAMQPVVRTVAANLAALVLTDPAPAGSTDPMLGEVVAPLGERPPVEPLAQIPTPRENRRARLMAYQVEADPHAPASSGAVRSRERITRRLSDDALYDSISRLGLTGQSVSIKF